MEAKIDITHIFFYISVAFVSFEARYKFRVTRVDFLVMFLVKTFLISHQILLIIAKNTKIFLKMLIYKLN